MNEITPYQEAMLKHLENIRQGRFGGFIQPPRGENSSEVPISKINSESGLETQWNDRYRRRGGINPREI